MPGRPTLTAGQIYVLLKGLLALTREAGCECRVPPPSLFDGALPAAANWRIEPPPPCEQGCDELIREIAHGVGHRFDMRLPGRSW